MQNTELLALLAGVATKRDVARIDLQLLLLRHTPGLGGVEDLLRTRSLLIFAADLRCRYRRDSLDKQRFLVMDHLGS